MVSAMSSLIVFVSGMVVYDTAICELFVRLHFAA